MGSVLEFALPYHSVPLAYDARFDISRYRELQQHYGDLEVRRILSEEIAADLLHHFAELEGIHFFSYRYLLNEQGVLVEDTKAQKPVEEMFKAKASPESLVWLNQMIPFLETSELGSSAFTISAKDPESDFENQYDFAYFFYKNEPNQISCFGLQMDLTPAQQALILNRFLEKKYQLSLEPSWVETRQTILYFEPGLFSSPSEAYLEILGNSLTHFSSKEDFDQFITNQNTWFNEKQKGKELLAKKITNMIADGSSPEKIQNELSINQREVLSSIDLANYKKTEIDGELYVLLPCGAISLGQNFGYLTTTMGDNIISSDYEWKIGECRICHTKNTSVGPCNVCMECQNKFDMGLIV